MNRPPCTATDTTGTAPAPTSAPHPDALIGRLAALTEALRNFDLSSPDTRPSVFTVAVVRLVGAVRDTVTAAAPVIDDAATLTQALRDAAADRRDLPDWCRDCRDAFDGLCADHEANLNLVEEYDHLHGLIFGPPGTGS